ncbi:hypothetical protein AUJ46_04010 [Candidatus Peregrinibacteria bacterium CG1_02_54_53]|nr:MAG: hypothetical protein AUJ46_04010 [Candidatus Peregrinibacteria bacterium CG1_02_54_53]
MTSYSFCGVAKNDFDRLRKKYRSLPDDLERFCKFTLRLEEEKGFPSSNKNYTHLKIFEHYAIYKAHIPCVSLRGNKLRIVYVRQKQSIEFIVLELYPKNEKSREDAERIAEYIENQK